MCQHHKYNEHQDFASDKKYRLADFFNMWWDEYAKNPTEFIEPEQYKAVAAMRVCQTEVLGVDYYACPGCGEILEIRHSCKNCFCPTCSWKDTIAWSARQQKFALKVSESSWRRFKSKCKEITRKTKP